LTNNVLQAYLCGMKMTGVDSSQLRQTRQVVQTSFPQIYLACHTRHERKRSNPKRLSARDAAILAHLDRSVAIAPSKLATHLGISASTLSEALKRLAALGLVAVPADAGTVRRRVSVVITEGGAVALSETSVLETQKLEEILAERTTQELRTISTGIALLASACRSHSDKARRLRGTPK
jgi:DNA-binding MarR family transcriptional regulator